MASRWAERAAWFAIGVIGVIVALIWVAEHAKGTL